MICGLLPVVLAISCHEPKPPETSCATLLATAQNHFSTYYRTKDSSELKLALQAANGANGCPDYRQRITALKISVLFLMQHYREVAAFIDSAGTEDFAKPYQKIFSKNVALAKAAGSGNDLKERDSLLRSNLNLISSYIRYSRRTTLDTTAVYDYFYTESLFLPKEKFLRDLDSAQKTREGDSVLFNVLRGSFYKTITDTAAKK